MSAFGGKADMGFCGAHFRLCDPKRTFRRRRPPVGSRRRWREQPSGPSPRVHPVRERRANLFERTKLNATPLALRGGSFLRHLVSRQAHGELVARTRCRSADRVAVAATTLI